MTLELSDMVKRLEKALFAENVSSRDIYEVIESLNMYAIEMRKWCSEERANEGLSGRVCENFERLAAETIDVVLKFYLQRLLEGRARSDGDLVGVMTERLLKAIEYFRDVAVKSPIPLREGVLCKVLKPFQMRHGQAPPGSIALLTADLAIMLKALGFVEIVTA